MVATVAHTVHRNNNRSDVAGGGMTERENPGVRNGPTRADAIPQPCFQSSSELTV